MKLSIIGAGYVGLTTAACLAEIGHDVICADNDTAKLAKLQSGQLPFFEPHLNHLVEQNVAAGRLRFDSPDAAIQGSHVIFICVGTPPLENGEADLSAIESVARSIVCTAHGYRLVIEKSTVPVQTAKRLWKHLTIYNTNGLEFDVASNPEFLREGSAVADFFHPDRIVVGAESPRAIALMKEIYRPILQSRPSCPVHQTCPQSPEVRLILTDTNSAELVKHASNSFLAMKISFINLVADACEAAGANIDHVAEGIGSDRRIGSAFLNPGVGFGGFCFPKDLQAFVRIGEKLGCDFSLLKEVEKINLRRIDQFVSKVRKELWVLRGKRLALWGLAFKPDTDDVRFAPSLAIARQLLCEGAVLHAYDPQAMDKAREQLPEIAYCASPYQAAQAADAILVLTEWPEFRDVFWKNLAHTVAHRLVIDGRNLYDSAALAKHGFRHVAIGKDSSAPSAVLPAPQLPSTIPVHADLHAVPVPGSEIPAAT